MYVSSKHIKVDRHLNANRMAFQRLADSGPRLNAGMVGMVYKDNIRICNECEGRIEKSVHEDRRLASRGLPSDDIR